MKIRRPTTDNDIAVYGNGVFMIRLFRGMLLLRILLQQINTFIQIN